MSNHVQMSQQLLILSEHLPLFQNLFQNLSEAPQGDAIILFMWQDDIIGVARFTDACLERVYTCAHQLAPNGRARHLVSPELAGKAVMILLLPCLFLLEIRWKSV